MRCVVRSTLVGGLAALVAGGVSAATCWAQFQSVYDPTTWAPDDLKLLTEVVGYLAMADVPGGVQLALRLQDSSFPGAASGGPYLTELLLPGGVQGTVLAVSGVSPDLGASRFSRSGFLVKGKRYNWRLVYPAASFSKGQTSRARLTGPGLTTASFCNAVKLIKLSQVGQPYTGWLGLNSAVYAASSALPLSGPGAYFPPDLKPLESPAAQPADAATP